MLRILPFPFSFSFLSPPRFFAGFTSLSPSKSLTISLVSTATTATASFSSTAVSIGQSSALGQSLPYGPALCKGHRPSEISNRHKLQEVNNCCHSSEGGDEENDGGNLFDEERFTRVFDLAALRVPSEHCFSLESRLRGHLLNWPRIRNIARVPGDEVEDEIKDLLPCGNSSNSIDSAHNIESESLVSLNRRVYGNAEGDGEPLSPVLYRDKLAKTFNSRGFVKFRNLAKMSRPKKRKKKEGETEKGEEKRIGKNQMAVVEVLEVVGEDDDVGDFSRLLGIEFKGNKWMGSTRLLLLDERYAHKGMNELPEAIKVNVCSHLPY